MTLPVPSCGGAVDLIHQWLPQKSGLEIDKVDLDIPDTTTEHEIGLRISNLFDSKQLNHLSHKAIPSIFVNLH